MTESEWLACDDPQEMLRPLQGRASDRKLRLFVVACCYLIESPSQAPLPIYEAAERFADDPAALDDVWRHWLQPGKTSSLSWPERPAEWATAFAGECRRGEEGDEDADGYPPSAALPPILREVFGNPFHPVVPEARWLTPVAVGLLGRHP